MVQPEKVIIDTDPAIGYFGRDVDDGLAIALALLSPEIEVIGITVTYGNIDLARAVKSAARLLNVMERDDIPLLSGAESQRSRGKATAASEFIRSHLEKSPGEVTLMTLGPLTNAATAEICSPGVLKKARRTFAMGGAVWGRGMIPPFFKAEFNFWKDPAAADLFVREAQDLTLMPLDLTKRVIVQYDRLLDMRNSGTPLAKWLFEQTVSWYALNVPIGLVGTGKPGFMPHDPLAVGALLWPDLFTYRSETLTVAARGTDGGVVRRGAGGARTMITEKVRETAFLDAMFGRLKGI